MEEENSKQAEARRILENIGRKEESIRQEKPIPQKSVPWSVSEDAAQLKALVEQSRGIKNQTEITESLPDPESIDPISVDQIKVMRNFVVDTDADKTTSLQHFYQAVIRSYFEAVDFLKPSNKAKRCLTDGHQCVHCGQKFNAPPLPAAKPESDG